MSIADIYRVQTVSGPAYSTPAHTAVLTTGGKSEVVLAARAGRQYALIVNDSDTTLYLALGAAAAANSGIRLNANGGSYEMSALTGNLYRGAVNVYCASAGKAVLVTEGI